MTRHARKWSRLVVASVLILFWVGLYLGLFKTGTTLSGSKNDPSLRKMPDCTSADFSLDEENCFWNINMKNYRTTFFSPRRHIQIDLYNFQCSNGVISFLFDLSYYSKKWFVKEQIQIITGREDICLPTMVLCQTLRCDRWKPIGHVKSVFNGSSTMINIHLSAISIELRLFEQMFAYRTSVRSRERSDLLTMQTRFNLVRNSGSDNIDGNAFMDGGEESGFMKFDINTHAYPLARAWVRTVQHLPWTLDLQTINDRLVTSITEACNLGSANARMSFADSSYSLRSGLLLRTTYQYQTNSHPSRGGLPWTAWLLADSPQGLADLAGFPGLLCPSPSASENFSWVQPGKVGRDMSLSTSTSKSWMDFGQMANLNYILLDAGYYGDEYNASSDPRQPLPVPREGPLNISAVAQYGRSLPKPIGLILYVNDIVLSKGASVVKHIADTFRSWGVAGIKMGFVQSKNQADMERIIENIQIFGREGLIVNVHDNFRDFYLSRTYPYLLSVEGISGDEHARNPAGHALILPFTRLLAGRADHTFTLDWIRLLTKNETIMFQIALPFLLYNGLQHLYWYRDVPSLFRLGVQPPLNLWMELPTEYEQSIFLAGEIGEYAAVARLDKLGRWFLIYVTTKSKSVTMTWDFLPAPISTYTLTIYEDIQQSYAAIRRHILPQVKVRRCRTTRELQLDLMDNGAFVVMIETTKDSKLNPCETN